MGCVVCGGEGVDGMKNEETCSTGQDRTKVAVTGLIDGCGDKRIGLVQRRGPVMQDSEAEQPDPVRASGRER